MNTRLIGTLIGGLLVGASTLALAGDWGGPVHGAQKQYRDPGDGWSPADRHWNAYRDYRHDHYHRHHGGCQHDRLGYPNPGPAWHFGPPRHRYDWQYGASMADGVTVILRSGF